jgi:hypothetical protein
VYVGKASRSLPARLRDHERKLSGRTGLSLATVSFICLYVDEDLEAASPETLLIKKYRHMGGPPWNTNGFGNKDPGRRRDTSEIAADHFDALYPINLNATVELTPGAWRVEELLAEVKRKLPYNLRYERTTPTAGTASVGVPSRRRCRWRGLRTGVWDGWDTPQHPVLASFR